MTLDLTLLCGIGDEAAEPGEAQIEIHRGLGFAGIEIRTLDGRWLHDIDEAEVSAFGTAVRAGGLTVPVVDTPIGNWERTVATDFDDELRLLRGYARRAQLLDCQQLRIMSYPNAGLADDDWRAKALDRVARLVAEAEQLGVTLLHENCAGWAGRTVDATLEMLKFVDSDHLALIFDIGNGAAYGYDALDFLATALPWVRHVHVKDAVKVDGQPVFVFPGEGECRLDACLRLLHTTPTTYWVSAEPHIAHMPHAGVTSSGPELRDKYVRYAEQLQTMVAQVVEEDRHA